MLNAGFLYLGVVFSFQAYTFIMFLVCAYAVAFVFSLLFEAPFINIDKLFITGAMKKKKD